MYPSEVNAVNTSEISLNRTEKLIYRGQAYERVTQNTQQLTQPKTTQLIYRGQVFNYVPKAEKPMTVSAVKQVELIYRGQIYNYTSPVMVDEAPRAINWRFQVAL